MYASSSKDDTTYVKNAAKNTNDATLNVVDKATGKMQETYGTAKKTILRATHTTTDHIRENPVQSTFIALGVGYVFGKLFGR